MIKKLVFQLSILCLLFLEGFQGYGQVGVFTKNLGPSAVLNINSTDKGFLVPRLTTVQKLAIVEPANSLLVFDTDQNSISQNIGTEQAPIWSNLTLFNKQSFYMPSINISTATLGTGTIDLFAKYKDQFQAPMYKSVGAPASIPHYGSANELFYYITYYDPTLITINSISNLGVLNYTTLKKGNYDSYINIVFAVK